MAKTRVVVMLDADILDKLKELAQRLARSLSCVMRDALPYGLDKLAAEGRLKSPVPRGRQTAKRNAATTWSVEHDWLAFDRVVDVGQKLKANHPDWDDNQLRRALDDVARREHVYDAASTVDRAMRKLRRIWEYESNQIPYEKSVFFDSNGPQ